MLPAVALVSAGALAYEVLLTRLFSIVQWHHSAYMIISIALLGYGASGAFLALAGEALRRHLGAAFAAGAALFAVSAVLSFAVAERLPFNPLAVIWEPRQLLFLPILYGLFALPFFDQFNTSLRLNPANAAFGQVVTSAQLNYARRVQIMLKYIF